MECYPEDGGWPAETEEINQNLGVHSIDSSLLAATRLVSWDYGYKQI